jgi:hypothetical protein
MKDIAIEVNLVDVCGAPYRDRLLEMVPSSTDPSSYKTFKLFDASPSFCRSFLIVSGCRKDESILGFMPRPFGGQHWTNIIYDLGDPDYTQDVIVHDDGKSLTGSQEF